MTKFIKRKITIVLYCIIGIGVVLLGIHFLGLLGFLFTFLPIWFGLYLLLGLDERLSGKGNES